MASQMNHSYFVIFDDIRGWNNTTQFTFFSEFNRPSGAQPFIEAFLLMTVFLFSFTENLILLIVLAANKQLRTPSNFFQASMAATSLLFVTSAPMIGMGRLMESWLMSEVACKFCILVPQLTGFILIWNMVVISIDRYKRVLSPGKHKMTKRAVGLYITFTWLTSLLMVPQVVYSYVHTIKMPGDNRTISYCTILYQRHDSGFRYSYVMFSTIVLGHFLIPVSIILHNYIKILHRLNLHQKKIDAQLTPVGKTSTLTRNHRLEAMKRRQGRHRKISVTLLSIMVVFLFMWLPLCASTVFIFAESASESYRMSSQLFIYSVILCFLNTCINPFLYGYNDDRVRFTFKRNVRHICRRMLPQESRIMRNRAMSLPRGTTEYNTDKSLDSETHNDFTSVT